MLAPYVLRGVVLVRIAVLALRNWRVSSSLGRVLHLAMPLHFFSRNSSEGGGGAWSTLPSSSSIADGASPAVAPSGASSLASSALEVASSVGLHIRREAIEVIGERRLLLSVRRMKSFKI